MEGESRDFENDIRRLFNQALKEPWGISEVLRQLGDVALRTFDADLCSTVDINPISRKPSSDWVTVGPHLDGETLPSTKPWDGDVTEKQLSASNGVLLVSDTFARPESDTEFFRIQNIRAYTCVTLRVSPSSPAFGVLIVGYHTPKEFFAADISDYVSFAREAAIQLERLWHAGRIATIASLGQMLNSELGESTRELFGKLTRVVPDILDTSSTLLLAIRDPQRDHFTFFLRTRKSWQTSSEDEFETLEGTGPGDGACQYVFETNREVHISDYLAEKDHLEYRDLRLLGNDLDTPRSLMFVPLTVRDQTLGILSVQSLQPNAFGHVDSGLLRLLANHITLALSNAVLYSSLSGLVEVGSNLTQDRDSEAIVLKSIANQIQRHTSADVVVVYPYDGTHLKEALQVLPHISGSLRDQEARGVTLGANDFATFVLKTGLPVFSRDSYGLFEAIGGDRSSRHGNFENREQIRSTAILPLIASKEQVGVLFVNYRNPQRFDSTQKLLIQGAASYAAIAIRNARALDVMDNRREREQSLLMTIARKIISTSRESEILGFILDEIRRFFPAADRASVMRTINDSFVTTVISGKGAPGVSASLEQRGGIVSWTNMNRSHAYSPNVGKDTGFWRLRAEEEDDLVSEWDMPLLDGADCIGLLSLGSSREDAFQMTDESFLTAISDQMVVAIRTCEARARYQAPIGVVEAIVGDLDLVTVFGRILDQAMDVTECSCGAFALYDSHHDDLFVAASRGVRNDNRNDRIPRGSGVAWRAIEAHMPLNIDTCRPDPNEDIRPMADDMCWSLAVPLFDDRQSVGALILESPRQRPFSPEDEELVESLGKLALVAIRNARAYSEALESSQRLGLLVSVAKNLGQISSLDSVGDAYRIIADAIAVPFDFKFEIRRTDSDGLTLKTVYGVPAIKGDLADLIPIGQGIVGQAAESRMTVHVTDVQVDSELSTPTDVRIRSLVAAPVIFGERLYGTLAISHANPNRFSDRDISLLGGLAQQLAATIARLEVTDAKIIAERQIAEEEAMASIGQSALEIVHRLGNELGLIPTWIRQVEQKLADLGVEQKAINTVLTKIRQSALRVLDLCSKLLKDISALQNSHGVLREIGQVSVATLVAEAIPGPHERSSAHVIRLDAIPDSLRVSVDPSEISHVLRNLIENAFQAMPGAGTLTVRIEDFANAVAIHISDTGIGIPKKNLDRVFHLFFSTKDSGGFGLWSAHQYALKNGGSLNVQSEVGKGSTFTLTIPKTSGNR